MQDAKPGSHTIWDCKYHIVWITKYRFPVMGGDVGQRARELLREIAQAHEMKIYAGSINRDHVHMLIGIHRICRCHERCNTSRGKVRTNFCQNINRFAKDTGANISGVGVIGSRPAAT